MILQVSIISNAAASVWCAYQQLPCLDEFEFHFFPFNCRSSQRKWPILKLQPLRVWHVHWRRKTWYISCHEFIVSNSKAVYNSGYHDFSWRQTVNNSICLQTVAERILKGNLKTLTYSWSNYWGSFYWMSSGIIGSLNGWRSAMTTNWGHFLNEHLFVHGSPMLEFH